MKNKILIIGASGHGKVIADIALNNNYKEIVFLDDNPKIKNCAGFKVLGTFDSVVKYRDDYDVAVAIGNPLTRKCLVEKLLHDGFTLPTLIHPSAVIGMQVHIGEGTVVMANAVVNPCTAIGRGCIINTGCTIDHDCNIDDFTHVSVGAHLAGTVSVGDRVWIGAGAVISNNLWIRSGCTIGAGAVVVDNIEEPGTYIGVPARKK